MARINETIMDIVNVPQGWTLTSAFSTDMNWIGLPGYLNEAFNITDRDNKDHKVGSVGKIDNLYMLFVKDSSYDNPEWSALVCSLQKLANKVEKKHIKKLAMPKICTGKNGFSWEDDVKPLIDFVFSDVDVDIMICTQ